MFDARPIGIYVNKFVCSQSLCKIQDLRCLRSLWLDPPTGEANGERDERNSLQKSKKRFVEEKIDLRMKCPWNRTVLSRAARVTLSAIRISKREMAKNRTVTIGERQTVKIDSFQHAMVSTSFSFAQKVNVDEQFSFCSRPQSTLATRISRRVVPQSTFLLHASGALSYYTRSPRGKHLCPLLYIVYIRRT